MKWACRKCGCMMHDQENSFFLFNYDHGVRIVHRPWSLKDYNKCPADGEIWRCPECDNVQFEKEEWPYTGEKFDFKRIADILKTQLKLENIE